MTIPSRKQKRDLESRIRNAKALEKLRIDPRDPDAQPPPGAIRADPKELSHGLGGCRVIVLDTHIWIWWVHGDPTLSESNRALLDSSEQTGIAVSAISCWEVARLAERGRLSLPCRSRPGASQGAPGEISADVAVPVEILAVLALQNRYQFVKESPGFRQFSFEALNAVFNGLRSLVLIGQLTLLHQIPE